MRTRIIAALAALALAALAVASAPSAAYAHDQLIHSTPAVGEDVAEAPARVSLVFSAEIMTLGATIIVADPEGHDWVVSEPAFAGSEVGVQLEDGMPAGGYQMRWQVVASDGHTISGVVPFTVGGGEPFVGIDSGGQQDQAAEESADDLGASPSTGFSRVILVGGVGALIALAAFTTFTLIRRRAQRPDDPGPGTDRA